MENCAVTVPSLATVTPVTVPKGEPSGEVPFKVEAVSNWVRPEVPPTAPRLTATVCAAKPVEAAHGMLRLKVPDAGAAPLTFFSVPSELKVTVPVPIGLGLDRLPAEPA